MATLGVNVTVQVLQQMSESSLATAEACGAGWSNGTCWLDAGWQGVAVAGLVGIRDFNARAGAYAPLLETLQGCDKQLTVSVVDSGTSARSAVQALLGAADASVCSAEPPDVVVGPQSSECCVPTAPMTGAQDIPQFSFGAASTALDDLATFPRFLRTFPTDTPLAHAHCVLWRELGYNVVGVIHPTDAYGAALQREIAGACDSHSIVALSFGYTPGDDASIVGAVSSISDVAPSVTLIVAPAPRDFVAIVELASQELLSFNASNSARHSLRPMIFLLDIDLEASSLGEASLEALNGSLRVALRTGADEQNPRWRQFLRDWPARAPADYNRVLPEQWQLAADFFSAFEDASHTLLRDVGTYEYDAVVAVGLLACHVAPTGPLPADFGTRLWGAKEAVAFDGLSGRVAFDAVGNRATGTVNARLTNLMLSDGGATGGGSRWSEVLRAEYAEGAWAWEGGSMQVRLSLLQRMSDARETTAEECAASSSTMYFQNGTCWLSQNWQAVAVAGLRAVGDFNARVGTYAPALSGDSMTQCDKYLTLDVLDSGSTGPTALVEAARGLSAGAYDAIVGAARSDAC